MDNALLLLQLLLLQLAVDLLFGQGNTATWSTLPLQGYIGLVAQYSGGTTRLTLLARQWDLRRRGGGDMVVVVLVWLAMATVGSLRYVLVVDRVVVVVGGGGGDLSLVVGRCVDR